MNKKHYKGKGKRGKGSNGDQFTKRQRAVESEDMRRNPEIRPDQRSGSDMHASTPNDWQWYAQSPQLIRDYASYPFGVPLGNRKSFGNTLADANAFPGIMTIEFHPTVGWADNENAPINMAMRRLYSFVRHANSGASNYDAPDLMMYLIAVDSALMFHENMKRCYGILSVASPYNRYFASAMVRALGFDYDDIVTNIANFRGYINQFAIKLSQLWIPNSLSYMARHKWMCEGIYGDSAAAKAQIYAYVPGSFYQFTLDGEGAGSLVPVIHQTAPQYDWKFADVVNVGNSLLDPMIASEDFGIMSGDILKAFGASGIIQVMGVTETYRVLPMYVPEVLSQIENTTLLGPNIKSNTVTQNTAVGTGWLQCSPTMTINVNSDPLPTDLDAAARGMALSLTLRKLLNMHHDNVTPEEVMVATRLSNIIALGDVTGEKLTTTLFGINLPVKTAGSELAGIARIYYFGDSAQGTWTLQFDSYTYISQILLPDTTRTSIANGFNRLANRASRISMFDWAPQCMPTLYTTGATPDITPSMGLLCDVDNYTMLDKENLENMTAAALLSEFSIPNI